MTAKVYVTLKSGVLDPQGSAIQHSVELMGTQGVSDIRQGKYFEISFEPGMTKSEASATVERIAKDVLANPVIEDYRVELATDS
ncbi:MAG: phosphoribosylformylglycinamidine synthase subunit PurS [Acidobacteriota bacterium]|nr:phosphoribosylformylglycinamidine synthase subunit PurS [Acidobacteriota bacterium]MDH3528927.1 phosphoribosylformylglycinamidine synthase subunit PurS [Acidobacteriota bacterium]